MFVFFMLREYVERVVFQVQSHALWVGKVRVLGLIFGAVLTLYECTVQCKVCIDWVLSYMYIPCIRVFMSGALHAIQAETNI